MKKKSDRESHTAEVINDITSAFEQRIDSWYIADGAVGLFRYKDGNAYEVTVRPARLSQYKELFEKYLKSNRNWYKKAKVFDGIVDGVPYMDSSSYAYVPEGYRIINIVNLLEIILPVEERLDYEEESKRVRQWAEEHNAHIYSAPRESFSISEAIKETEERGKTLVIVEDLS